MDIMHSDNLPRPAAICSTERRTKASQDAKRAISSSFCTIPDLKRTEGLHFRLTSKLAFQSAKFPTQANGYDCGVYVIGKLASSIWQD